MVSKPRKSFVELKVEAYNEVADWLSQLADNMQRKSEQTVFMPRPAKATLDAEGVRGLARDLRTWARKVRAGK